MLDHAKAHAAAAVHGRACGFVDGNEVLVLQQQREFARRCRALGLVGHFFGHAHGRQAHLVARIDPGVGAGTAFVDAHLATADDAIDVGLGHTLELAQQKVVQPLARRFGIDLHGTYRRWCSSAWGLRARRRPRQRFGPYNVFHLRSVL